MKTPNRLIVAGTDTNVGKTIVSSLLVAKLNAYYWKPIQCGELDTGGDSATIKKLTGIKENRIIPEAYRLKMAASPNQAAEAEGITIEDQKLKLPSYGGALVVELAGGLMVPLNNHYLVIDLIAQLKAPVILVSRNYLGSINHTLLSAMALHQRQIPVQGIVFNGDEMEGTEEAILSRTGYKVLGRIAEEPVFDKAVIAKYAAEFAPQLQAALAP